MNNVIEFRNPIIRRPSDAIAWLSDIKSKDYENFVCLYIGENNNIIQKKIVFTGEKSFCNLKASTIWRDILMCEGCVAVIFAHNHPGGSLYPSDPDMTTTKVLKEGGEILGIQVLDHVIVTAEGYYSFAEHNQM